MSYDVDNFDADQKSLVALLVSDAAGPTATSRLLRILDNVLGELDPDWEINPQSLSPELRKEVGACIAALHYDKVTALADA